MNARIYGFLATKEMILEYIKKNEDLEMFALEYEKIISDGIK